MMLSCKTASLSHFPRVGGTNSLINKTYKKKSQKQIEKQSTWLIKEEMPLMKWNGMHAKQKENCLEDSLIEGV